MAKTNIEINPVYNRNNLGNIFGELGRIHIPDFLDLKAAKAIHREIVTGLPWKLSIGNNGGNLDYDYAELMAQPKEDIEKFNSLIIESARNAFQYRFRNYRLSDLVKSGDCNYPKLKAFYDFLNSAPFLIFMRNLTGVKEGIYCDAQVTNFASGDFLSDHHDEDLGKGRIAAFVFNFTPHWRTDWGGQLQFIDSDNHITEAYTPCFNALNVLRVPQKHAVAYVTPFASGERISITGWFRRNRD